ncbi:EAL domain, c-di-GMP-specific phosphodiesterase class I (or its enzymatically inactive variant) [Kaistia soli DSM 19436]|uniref:EAL domain, c-di-GMP-specific phosphodiesterase class I (Or its enzymatically inactive variant) n=2 Tax=Kaistia TaxID=166953 RepID=A0A1M4WWA8_9HYPH|nr:EAL domain, c-di-GMP-specific phosphodiesterase class I (or its enzymatically inactive variant) [Kaistia soli DSM 19436]
MGEPAGSVLQRLQHDVLEAIALGISFPDVAMLICLNVEALAPGTICTLIRIKEGRFQPVAAPSLPCSYSDALNGLAIGPNVGSCGTAAWTAGPVEVRDIETDPLWADYRDLALPLGLRACWSSPVIATDGSVLATFALYYREARGPTPLERSLVKACIHLSAIAIERSDAEEVVRQLASYDPLTGLPNRRSFDAAIGKLCNEGKEQFGLLLVGVERLDLIDIGIEELSSDNLLREIAHRLQELGPDASIFCLGGGLFAVLISPCADREELREFGLRVLSVLHRPRDWLSVAVDRGVSLGGALSGSDGSTPEVLRQNAELARAASRSNLHSGYVDFEPHLRTAALQRRAAFFDVETALAEQRIIPHYQPVVRLDSGRIVGLEALLRMRRRDGSIVAAAEFQEVFSDPRLAYHLTDHLIAEVAKDIAGWTAAGIDCGHVGINVAPADFIGESLGVRLEAAMAKAGVPLSRIVVEITEIIFMDDPRHNVADLVEDLRKRGARVALDDFGTGFASLTHLLTFPSDIIKIDRSFIDRLVTDPCSAVIVESLVDIALKLGKRVVAEGVETQLQADRLLSFGCTLGQGYLFAKPADVAVTTRRLSGRYADAVV